MTLCVDEVLDIAYDKVARKAYLTSAASPSCNVVFSNVFESEYDAFCKEMLYQGYSDRWADHKAKCVWDDEEIEDDEI